MRTTNSIKKITNRLRLSTFSSVWAFVCRNLSLLLWLSLLDLDNEGKKESCSDGCILIRAMVLLNIEPFPQNEFLLQQGNNKQADNDNQKSNYKQNNFREQLIEYKMRQLQQCVTTQQQRILLFSWNERQQEHDFSHCEPKRPEFSFRLPWCRVNSKFNFKNYFFKWKLTKLWRYNQFQLFCDRKTEYLSEILTWYSAKQ